MSNHTEFPKLGKPLEEEVAKMPRVRLIRTKKREGLVRARLLGAEVAQEMVLKNPKNSNNFKVFRVIKKSFKKTI